MRKRVLIIVAVLILSIATTISLVACSRDGAVHPEWAYDGSLYTEDASMTEGANVRIMSYNLLVEAWGGDKKAGIDMDSPIRSRAEQAGKMLNYYLPDVVGLQEVCESWHSNLPKKISDNYTFLFDKGNNYTSMIYNHNKVNLVEQGKFDYTMRSEGRMRYVAWAVFERKEGGAKFGVLNTHFDFGPKKRDKQVQQMKEFADVARDIETKYNAPAFLVGDYNAYDNIPPKDNKELWDYNHANDLYIDFRDKNSDNFKDANYIEGIVLKDGKNRKVFDAKWDHIFVSNSVDVKGYTVLSNDYYKTISDHFPIFIDVAL